jgi:2-polyprenyl-6-methoxyphenol hydroxylase-like FAD-dependent oxidoreductase
VRIACVGAGPGGLYFSILMKLRDPQHEVTVFERSLADAKAGWGVTLDHTQLDRMAKQDQESADQIRAIAFVWRQQVTHVRGEQVIKNGDDEFNISRRRLLDVLADRARDLGVRIEYGVKVPDASQLADADLIVAADGVNSAVRSSVEGFGTNVALGTNKYIWLGSDKVFEKFRFIFKQTDHGWIWVHTYAINASSSTFIVECSERTWAGLGFDAMSEQETIAVLEDLYKAELDGHKIITLGDRAAQWLNFRTVSNQNWHVGNVVLLGDSARTVHFSVGMGTVFAVQDAITLADSLQEQSDLQAALQSYEQQRKRKLRPRLLEAEFSRRWLEKVEENIVTMNPRHFGVLLYSRRSPLVHTLPAGLSYLLIKTSGVMMPLHAPRAMAAPVIKAFYNWRARSRPQQATAPDSPAKTTSAVHRKG